MDSTTSNQRGKIAPKTAFVSQRWNPSRLLPAQGGGLFLAAWPEVEALTLCRDSTKSTSDFSDCLKKFLMICKLESVVNLDRAEAAKWKEKEKVGLK